MWFVYALLGAVGKSYSGFFRKKIAASVSGSMYIWIGYTLILLIMTPLITGKYADIVRSLTSYPLIAIGAADSSMIATQLNLAALKREDLSYTAPLNAFVPVFTLALAIPILGEAPPTFGLLGIVLVVAGAHVVSIKPDRVDWYDPLRRLTTSAGAQLSIGVAVCYAVNTILLKILSGRGFDPYVVLYVTTLVRWVLLLYVPLRQGKELRRIDRSDTWAIFGGSVSSFAGSFFHILALAHTYTSFATAVRRLDSVISVLLGWRYLKEKSIRFKLIGSIVMTVGAVVMLLA